MELTEKQIDHIQQFLDSGMKCYVHKETGEIIDLLDFDDIYDTDEYEELEAENLKKIEDNKDDYVEIEKMSSREGFQVMESFVDVVSNRNIKERLIRALSGRKPFSNFKHQVDNSGDVREKWFAHKAAAYTNYVREKLEFDFDLPEAKEKPKLEESMEIDFDEKTLVVVSNSENGEVSSDTIFEFSQEDDIVTADYDGGTIRYGKIIGHLKEDKLELVYQCLTNENKLRSGKGLGTVKLDNNGKIGMMLEWEWLDGKGEKGMSEYKEK